MGGAAGHMAHPFDLPSVNTGADLIDFFESASQFLAGGSASVKIDGVNVSFKLVNTPAGKQFAVDRGSTKPIDVEGITLDRISERWPEGHGMLSAVKTLLSIFNAALPKVTSELKELGMYDDPTVFMNTEYVLGKTNVTQYDKNFLAIHGLNQFYEKVNMRNNAFRPGITKPEHVPKGVPSIEVPYNKEVLQSFIDKVAPFAAEHGYEVYGDVPTETTGEVDFSSTLSSQFTVQMSEEQEETHSLGEWLRGAQNPRGQKVTVLTKDRNQKVIGALSKEIYLSVLNEVPLLNLIPEQPDIESAINGAIFYHATKMLGNDVLQQLTSPMGDVKNHEGIVLRSLPGYANVPVKITGEFILGGMQTSFREHKELNEQRAVKVYPAEWNVLARQKERDGWVKRFHEQFQKEREKEFYENPFFMPPEGFEASTSFPESFDEWMDQERYKETWPGMKVTQSPFGSEDPVQIEYRWLPKAHEIPCDPTTQSCPPPEPRAAEEEVQRDPNWRKVGGGAIHTPYGWTTARRPVYPSEGGAIDPFATKPKPITLPVREQVEPEEMLDLENEEEQEQEGPTIVIIPGAFKPPHRGHLDMVMHYLQLPKVDQVIVFISPIPRQIDGELGVAYEQSQKIWDLYAPGVAEQSPVASPVGAAFEYVDKLAPKNSKVILGASVKGGDISRFEGQIEKYAREDVTLLDPLMFAAPAGKPHTDKYMTLLEDNPEILKHLPSFKNPNRNVKLLHASDMRYLAGLAGDNPIAIELFQDFLPPGLDPIEVLKILKAVPGDEKDILGEGSPIPLGIFLRLIEEVIDEGHVVLSGQGIEGNEPEIKEIPKYWSHAADEQGFGTTESWVDQETGEIYGQTRPASSDEIANRYGEDMDARYWRQRQDAQRTGRPNPEYFTHGPTTDEEHYGFYGPAAGTHGHTPLYPEDAFEAVHGVPRLESEVPEFERNLRSMYESQLNQINEFAVAPANLPVMGDPRANANISHKDDDDELEESYENIRNMFGPAYKNLEGTEEGASIIETASMAAGDVQGAAGGFIDLNVDEENKKHAEDSRLSEEEMIEEVMKYFLSDYNTN